MSTQNDNQPPSFLSYLARLQQASQPSPFSQLMAQANPMGPSFSGLAGLTPDVESAISYFKDPEIKEPYSDAVLDDLWNRTTSPRFGYDHSIWGDDQEGHFIRRAEYGQQTEHGWSVDHIIPKNRNGSNRRSNLRALHHRANSAKGDSLPSIFGMR